MLLVDGRKVEGDRSPEPPDCIEDCVVLDEVGQEEEVKVEGKQDGAEDIDDAKEKVAPPEDGVKEEKAEGDACKEEEERGKEVEEAPSKPNAEEGSEEQC